MKILTDPRSGSYQGITSSRNRFGQYVRTRATPVQPRTPKQTTNRSYFTQGASQWRTLDDAKKTAWNDYAGQLSRSDSLGSSYSPTGMMLFVGASVILQGITPTDPPSVLPNYYLTVSGITYVDPTPGPEALNIALAQNSADNFVIIETSGPISAGVTSAAAVRRWRSLPSNDRNLDPAQFAMTASPIDVITNYKYLFPSPNVGDAIWFRFREISYPGGGDVPITNRLFQTYKLLIA